MDKSLQERLVGAAVLVALGVWLIPWVLDGSAVDEPAQSERVALKLPVPDRGADVPIRRETIDLGAADRGAAPKSPQSPPAQTAPQPVAEAAAVSAPPAAADDSAELPAQQPPTVEDSAPPSQPVATAPAPEAGTNSVANAGRAATSDDTGADSTAAAAPSTAEILAASPVAGWMVQLGSFSDAGNARRQASRINTFGHDARIYEFSAGGRKMFRVRLGPVDSRERAEAAASALAAHGFVAQLVAPE